MSSEEVTLDRYLEIVFCYFVCKTHHGLQIVKLVYVSLSLFSAIANEDQAPLLFFVLNNKNDPPFVKI